MISFLVSCYFSLPFPIVQCWYQIYRTCGWIIPLTYRCGAKTSTGIFFGCDLVNWLLQVGLASDRGEAVVYGDRLLKGGVIQHITKEFEFRDEYLYYRFIPKKPAPVESHWTEHGGKGEAAGVSVPPPLPSLLKLEAFLSQSSRRTVLILPWKIQRCGSTCVYSEENGRKLYLVSIPTRMLLNKTRCSGFRTFFSILSKTNSKMLCVTVVF